MSGYDLEDELYDALVALVQREEGRCEPGAGMWWCDHHHSRIRLHRNVCDTFESYLSIAEEGYFLGCGAPRE